jgi:ATP synthase protein I
MAEDDDERLRANLARLRGSLDKARDKARATREAERPANSNRPQGDSGTSLAMRAGSEFISAIVVGAGIGWGLDRLLGMNPLFLIVFFFIGVAAGVWNVIRLTSPKGGGSERDSRLSHTEAADKGLRPSGPRAARDASPRGASGGTNGAGNGPDDDED